MNERHVSIAAAALAALIVGVGPAAAQISRGLDTRPGNTSSSDTTSGSVSGGTSGSASGSTSGSVNTNDNTNVNSNTDANTQSPSASPSMGDDRAKPDDRDRMKQQEQNDKKNGLDRADEAAGSHGAQGRANARTRGNRP